MHDFTRRSLLQGGTALAAAGALTGPALFDFAKAWAQAAPVEGGAGAKLTVMRWKRFVPAEDDAFNADGRRVQDRDRHRDERVLGILRGRAAEGVGRRQYRLGPRYRLGPAHAAAAVPDQSSQDERRCDYLGNKYGGWTDAAAKTCKQGNDWLGIPSRPSAAI
jgi:multiple sugar transport system substrate-binding protein